METVFAERPEPEISPVISEASVQKQKRSAFVFITTEIDESHLVLEDLRKLDSVDEVYLARGAYDVVAKVSGDSMDYLRDEVIKQIRTCQASNLL